MARLFGTDGVRGVANEKLTGELAYRLGFAGARVLAGKEKGSSHKPLFLIGMDTRISCKMLETALIAGLCSAGADVIRVGVIPTPGVAYLTGKYGCDAGVMISASHNTYEYNGIKFFSGDGYKLPDSVEDEIEEIVNDFDAYRAELPIGADIGSYMFKDSAAADYLQRLKDVMSVDLKGMKLAVDSANGAASGIAQKLFADLGADVVAVGDKPDGININAGCGSTHLDKLAAVTVAEACDMGLAFDGDADRFLCVDRDGNVIDGDRIMSVIGLDMKARGILKQDTITVTVMSNLGMDIMAQQKGIKLAKTKVGDRYVLEEMKRSGYNIGGEQSGHVILLDVSTTGDGMLTALALLTALRNSGKSIAEAASVMEVLPQVLVAAYVNDHDKEAAMQMPELHSRMDEMQAELGCEGRILVRPSGTEPMIRVMLEGKDIGKITSMANELAAIINSKYKMD